MILRHEWLHSSTHAALEDIYVHAARLGACGRNVIVAYWLKQLFFSIEELPFWRICIETIKRIWGHRRWWHGSFV